MSKRNLPDPAVQVALLGRISYCPRAVLSGEIWLYHVTVILFNISQVLQSINTWEPQWCKRVSKWERNLQLPHWLFLASTIFDEWFFYSLCLFLIHTHQCTMSHFQNSAPKCITWHFFTLNCTYCPVTPFVEIILEAISKPFSGLVYPWGKVGRIPQAAGSPGTADPTVNLYSLLVPDVELHSLHFPWQGVGAILHLTSGVKMSCVSPVLLVLTMNNLVSAKFNMLC